MIINTEGIVIRMFCEGISILRENSQSVKLKSERRVTVERLKRRTNREETGDSEE